jgi:tetratricopeptide (TPR) repeat protein
MLRLQPKLRSNWVGLAVAYHLAGQLDKADEVLSKYEGMLEEVKKGDYELGEIVLYHARLLEDMGKLEEAWTYLDRSRDRIVDRKGWQEAKARVLYRLGRSEEAASVWLEQIDDNPESHANIRGYVEARGHKLRKFGQVCIFWSARSNAVYSSGANRPRSRPRASRRTGRALSALTFNTQNRARC